MPPPSPEPAWAHTGAILAGGRSSRMGRRKESLPWEGGTMIDAVAAALSQVCRRVVVVGAADTGLPAIKDLRPGQGPLGAIEALLASGIDSEYLVCPCDLPLVSGTLLARLTGQATNLATVFRVEGEAAPRPLPARFSAGALGPVRAQLDRGERAVRDLLRAIQPRAIVLGASDAQHLADVNSPQEYAACAAIRGKADRSR
jgi:molybdopterin-guanine dinucleotide biosynthesis protein A